MVDKAERNIMYVRNPDVVLREEDQDGGLLFNPDTNQIRVLNATALFIWKLCDGKHRVGDIVSAIKKSFDQVPPEQISGQVENHIKEMAANGFIGTKENG